MEYQNKSGYIFTVTLMFGEYHISKTRENWRGKGWVVFQDVAGGYKTRAKAGIRLAEMASRYGWERYPLVK